MNQTPKGRIRWAVTALAIACCAALPATAAASSARSQVIVQLDAGASADAVKAQVREYGGRVTGDLPIINGFAAKLSDGAAASLQRADGVHAVTRNARLINNRYPAVEAYKTLEAAYYGRTAPISTAGLVPNEIVNASTGDIDYSRSSWSRSSWSSADGGLTADFARSSWSRSSWSSVDSSGMDVTRSSWSRSSWSTSWDK